MQREKKGAGSNPPKTAFKHSGLFARLRQNLPVHAASAMIVF